VVAGREPIISPELLSQVKIINSSGGEVKKWTAAQNRNLGIFAAQSELVAFLDDDDIWYPNKMEKQLVHFKDDLELILLCRANYSLRGKWIIERPRKSMTGEKSILEFHYGKKRILPSPYYSPTPSIVTSKLAAQRTPMNEELLGFEDTWWLHELQNNGLRLIQLDEKLIEVSASPIRSIARDTRAKNIAWARQLSSVNRSFGLNYLQGICFRNALLRFKFRDAFYYLQARP